MTRVLGSELKVGDTIETVWNPNRDTILALEPYIGPLDYLFEHGAQAASFALLKDGMTIDNGDYYIVINR